MRDPYTKRYWPFRTGRDPARTPMQWDESLQAGFTTGQPWLPISGNLSSVNVENESKDPLSLLSLYRRLIRLRKTMPTFSQGIYRPMESTDPNCLVFIRKDDRPAGSQEDLLVAVNFSSQRSRSVLSGMARHGTLLLSTYEPTEGRRPWHSGSLDLQPDEAIIVALT